MIFKGGMYLKQTLYAFIGGDLRQSYLLKRFLAAGGCCITYGTLPDSSLSAPEAPSGQEARQHATHILGPIPVATNSPIDTNEFPEILSADQTVYGGAIPKTLLNTLTEKGIICYDYMKNESLTLFNSIATAEGIAAQAVLNYPGNLHGSNCLVLGFGRCGKTLADRLSGLHANVSVGARKEKALAEAYSLGYPGFILSSIQEELSRYDLIFNTIPEIILTAPVLQHVKQGSYIFDIASAPGGVDLPAAHQLGINAERYPGLPGKFAPAASADALYDYIMQTNNTIS